MRRVIGVVICTVLIAVACNKPVGVTVSTEEQMAKDLTIIDEYLAAHNINAVKYDSVRWTIDELGTGDLPTKDKCVTFRYAGYELYDSVAFDSNNTTDSNTSTGLKSPLKHLVTGMQIGMKHMPVGTKGWIYMPSVFAYGSDGRWDSENDRYIVHPNACLKFQVEIVALSDYNVLGNYCYE